jgi:hypothetical protein
MITLGQATSSTDSSSVNSVITYPEVLGPSTAKITSTSSKLFPQILIITGILFLLYTLK